MSRIWIGRLIMIAVLAAVLALGVWVLSQVPELQPNPALREVAKWFDPAFFAYNLLLLVASILLPALLAFSYVSSMGEEKTRRIRRELGALWEPNEGWISEYIAKQLYWLDYVVGVFAMCSVVAFGASVLLLLKPVNGLLNPGMTEHGLDFSHGANLLLLGPYVREHGKHFDVVVHSLTAYAFGFLGAYIYSTAQLVRGYFCADLPPNAFISAAVRIVVASTTALVAAFGLSTLVVAQSPTGVLNHTSESMMMALLPVLGFFFGYFPSRALKFIQHLANRLLRTAEGKDYGSTSLNKVSGMNSHHADRLEREGIDNVENLAAGEPIEIALRTGFPYPQVKAWVGEARLRVHLARHFAPFAERTGIRTFDQLSGFAQRWDTKARGSAYVFLAGMLRADGETKSRLAAKLEAIVLLCDLINPAVDAEVRSENAQKESAFVAPAMPIRRVSSSSIQAS
jgi:hypothetical protein